jgi:hypothetical protein
MVWQLTQTTSPLNEALKSLMMYTERHLVASDFAQEQVQYAQDSGIIRFELACNCAEGMCLDSHSRTAVLPKAVG